MSKILQFMQIWHLFDFCELSGGVVEHIMTNFIDTEIFINLMLPLVLNISETIYLFFWPEILFLSLFKQSEGLDTELIMPNEKNNSLIIVSSELSASTHCQWISVGTLELNHTELES